MLHVLFYTVLPIFSIVFLGYFLKARGLMDPAYIRNANQIVFNVAIPAMLFTEISSAPFWVNFNATAVICSLGAMALLVALAVIAARLLVIPADRRSTFIQSCFHGNIGYMSYAIAYYALGEESFARMAILSSFVTLAQNLLAVWTLTVFTHAPREARTGRVMIRLIVRNPVIVSIFLGIVMSAVGLPLAQPLKKALDILSGMAFPTALLLIGASLSFGAFRVMVREIIGIGALKLLGLPLLGYTLMKAAGVPDGLILPGMILLGAPPATITYVMATELGGHPELAATSISIFTLLSAFSYSAILAMLSG